MLKEKFFHFYISQFFKIFTNGPDNEWQIKKIYIIKRPVTSFNDINYKYNINNSLRCFNKFV